MGTQQKTTNSINVRRGCIRTPHDLQQILLSRWTCRTWLALRNLHRQFLLGFFIGQNEKFPNLDLQMLQDLPDFNQKHDKIRVFFNLFSILNDMKTGWWLNHPSEKYDRQIGNLPQIGVKIKKYLKPPPRISSRYDRHLWSREHHWNCDVYIIRHIGWVFYWYTASPVNQFYKNVEQQEWMHLSMFELISKSWSSWWFQPIWKIIVKLDHFPR